MPIPQPFNTSAPAVTATTLASGLHRFDVFITAGSPDTANAASPNLWHRWSEDDGQTWQPTGKWKQRGGNWASGPAAAALAPRKTHVFGLGLNGQLWHTAQESGWNPELLGSPPDRKIISAPSVTVSGDRHLRVFVRTEIARGSNRGRQGIWELNYDAGAGGAEGTWQKWAEPAAHLQNALGVASWSDSREDVFAVSDAGYLRHRWKEGDTVGGWEGGRNQEPITTGLLTSSPASLAWSTPSGAIFTVFCFGPQLGFNGRVDIKSWLGRHWRGQATVYASFVTEPGWNIIGYPAIASWGKPRLDVFFAAENNQITVNEQVLKHRWSDNGGRTWHSGTSVPLDYFPQ